MGTISSTDRLAWETTSAIHSGDLDALRRLLDAHPDLAASRIAASSEPMARTLLHLATDWPGHFRNGAATVALLVERGADPNARFQGAHEETPLHWAASCDDVEVLDALLDAGADIEAPGAVIAGGPPLADALAFRQWKAAYRLVERGATTDLRAAAALELMDRVEASFAGEPPEPDEINLAFWYACHGGRLTAARYLRERGADIDWLPPWDAVTPLDTALDGVNAHLVVWLREEGATIARKPSGS